MLPPWIASPEADRPLARSATLQHFISFSRRGFSPTTVPAAHGGWSVFSGNRLARRLPLLLLRMFGANDLDRAHLAARCALPVARLDGLAAEALARVVNAAGILRQPLRLRHQHLIDHLPYLIGRADGADQRIVQHRELEKLD